MKIHDIRIELKALQSGAIACAEVEMDFDDARVYVFQIQLNPHNLYEPAYTGQYNSVGLQNKMPKKYENATLDDYMPQIRDAVAHMISNKVFAEYDKMQSLKE